MKCKICANPAQAAGLCRPCYHYIYRAMRRGVSWMIQRRDRVQLWADRLDMISKKENVVHIKRRRSA